MEAIQFVSDSRDADYIFDDDDEANFIQAAFSSGCSWHIVYELAIVHQETRLHFYQPGAYNIVCIRCLTCYIAMMNHGSCSRTPSPVEGVSVTDAEPGVVTQGNHLGIHQGKRIGLVLLYECSRILCLEIELRKKEFLQSLLLWFCITVER